MPEKHKESYRVGAFIRRNFRAALDQNDIEYNEHRSMLDSIFVINATAKRHAALHEMIERSNNA